MKTAFSVFVGVFFLMNTQQATAAQRARIIVDNAAIYQFPRSDSETISDVKKNEWVVVSNFPTEGYFKIRLSTGEVGWISGNDLVTQRMMDEEARQNGEVLENDPTLEVAKKDVGWRSESRILLGGGMQSLSLYPLNSLTGVNNVTLGYNASAEFQFAIFKYFHWAFRGEWMFSSAGPTQLTTGATRRVEFRSFPLSAGLVFSFPDFKWFRLSVAAYGGVALGTLLQVQDKTAAQVGTLAYNSYDPFGVLALQGTIGISDLVGIFLEGGYRYQSADQDASTAFGIPAITVDYSGFQLRTGLEFRFR